MELIITCAVAVVAATLGALVTHWLKSSKPWLGIIAISRDDRQLVTVSTELQNLTQDCNWLKGIERSEVPLRTLVDLKEKIQELLHGLKSSLKLAEDFEESLRSDDLPNNELRTSLVTFLADEMVLSSLLGMFRRQTLPLPEESSLQLPEQPLLEGNDLTKEGHNEKLYVVDVDDGKILIRPGTVYAGQAALSRTRALGHILQYGLQDHLRAIVSAVAKDSQADFQRCLEIKERLADTIQARRLMVRAQITNMGGSPEHLEPFGILRVHTTGKPVAPIIVSVQKAEIYEPGFDMIPSMLDLMEGMARKQGVQSARIAPGQKDEPIYVVVKPGDVVECELSTIEPVEDAEIFAALQNGMLSCELVLRRSGRKRRKWVTSARQILGFQISSEKREELLSHIG